MVSDEIPLDEAPEHFFDQQKWSEFVDCFDNRQAALQQINRPEPGIIGFYRRQIANSAGPMTAKAQREEHTAELGKALVADFKERLSNEEIVATGLSSLAVARVTIPSERWPELWPNFAADKAEGKELTFAKVRVSKPASRRTSSIRFLEECIAWLQQRQLEGESCRKVLEAEASNRFGSVLKTRDFAAAYKAVFEKPRGRPPKTSPK